MDLPVFADLVYFHLWPCLRAMGYRAQDYSYQPQWGTVLLWNYKTW